MRKHLKSAFFIYSILFILLQALPALAKTSYLVLPFSVNGNSTYTYLEKAVPPMLSSRFFWKDNVEPAANQEQVSKPATSAKQALELNTQSADYVVWGAITILGENASIDISVTDKAGESKQFANTTKLDSLIPALQCLSDNINKDVFGRQVATTAQPKGPLNQALVVNETGNNQTYLNPELRYEGDSEESGRFRSQSLNYTAYGFAFDDVNNDGKSEVIILTEFTLYVYSFAENLLKQIGTIDMPRTLQALNVRTYNFSGNNLIIVNMVDPENAFSYSQVYTYENGKITEFAKRLPFYMNVVNLPPNFKPVLIGQRGGNDKFTSGSISEVVISDKNFTLGGAVPGLIKEANLFNFAYVPGDAKSGGDKIVVLDEREKLNVYSLTGTKLSQTDDRYSGTAVGVTLPNNVPGLGKDPEDLGTKVYMPMRMPVTDFDKNKIYEILVNKPISTASQFFDRYRSFPQGELEALYWDGVGLNLQWKTRRIKGTVVDIDVTDINGDKKPEIAVLINSHTGGLNLATKRSMVLFYPLEASMGN